MLLLSVPFAAVSDFGDLFDVGLNVVEVGFASLGVLGADPYDVADGLSMIATVAPTVPPIDVVLSLIEPKTPRHDRAEPLPIETLSAERRCLRWSREVPDLSWVEWALGGFSAVSSEGDRPINPLADATAVLTPLLFSHCGTHQ